MRECSRRYLALPAIIGIWVSPSVRLQHADPGPGIVHVDHGYCGVVQISRSREHALVTLSWYTPGSTTRSMRGAFLRGNEHGTLEPIHPPITGIG